MQIHSTRINFKTPQMGSAQAKPEAFTPAAPQDLVSIGSSLEGQDRFDGGPLKLLGVLFYGGMGAAGGGVAGVIGGAASGLSGWGTAAAGLGGMVAGAVIGGYMGS